MANIKTGLNYFTIDTDRYQDRRIKRLKKKKGCSGLSVYDYILCETYRVRGCYLEYDENTVFDVAEYFGLDESDVRSIIDYCGSIGLFNDKKLLDGIITSESIQSRYTDMCLRAKRKIVEIPQICRLDYNPPLDASKQIREEQYRLTLEDEICALKDDEDWIEQIMALHKLVEFNDLLKYIEQFRMQCIADGKEQHQSLQDAKQHFNSWLRKVISKPKKNDDKVRSTSNSKRRGNILAADESKKYGDSF